VLAVALRGDLRSRVALVDRLRIAAGSSLRHYTTKTHARRERIRLELRAESGRNMTATDSDTLGDLITAQLARLAHEATLTGRGPVVRGGISRGVTAEP